MTITNTPQETAQRTMMEAARSPPSPAIPEPQGVVDASLPDPESP